MDPETTNGSENPSTPGKVNSNSSGESTDFSIAQFMKEAADGGGESPVAKEDTADLRVPEDDSIPAPGAPAKSVPAAPIRGAQDKPSALAKTSSAPNDLPKDDRIDVTAELMGKPKDTFKRDLTGLDEREARIFNNMSREAYSTLLPIYKEHKQTAAKINELETALNEAKANQQIVDYSNPNAWILTNEAVQLQSNVSRFGQEAGYWQEQLANIRAGKPWYPLMIGQNGQYTAGEERQPDPASEAEVIRLMNLAYIYQQDAESKLNQYAGQFKQQHQTFEQGLQQAGEKYFGKVDWSKLKPNLDVILSQFPSHLRGQTTYQLLAKSVVAMDLLQRYIQKMTADKAVTHEVNRTAVSSGPGAGGASSSGHNGDNLASDDKLWEKFSKMTG